MRGAVGSAGRRRMASFAVVRRHRHGIRLASPARGARTFAPLGTAGAVGRLMLDRRTKGDTRMDVVFVLTVAALFAAGLGFVELCGRV